MLESLLGEFLDDTMGLPGYSGAVVLGLGVTASVYPIHKRLSRYTAIQNTGSELAGAQDFRSAGVEIARSIKKFYRTVFIRYWYVFVPLIVVGGLIGWFTSMFIWGGKN